MGKPTRVRAYGQNQPLIDVFPFPLYVSSSPTAADKDFEIGQIWIYNQSSTQRQVYVFAGLDASKNAIWSFVSAGSTNLETLTGDSGGALSPTAGNINILGSGLISVTGSGSTLTIGNSAGGANITPWVVGPTGGYATIASAITAAHTAGGNQTIYIQPGTYTENLTLYTGLSFIGSVAGQNSESVQITGVMTPPTGAGVVSFSNIDFNGTTHCVYSLASGATQLEFNGCNFAVASAGVSLDLTNWTGPLVLVNCGDNSAADNGGIDNALGSSAVLAIESTLGFGTGTKSLLLNGVASMWQCEFICPVVQSGGTGSAYYQCNFIGYGITMSGASTGFMIGCYITSGTASCITMSSSGAWGIYTSVLTSSNTNAIGGSGAGVLTIGNLIFLNSILLNAGLTLAYGNTQTGALTTHGSVNLTTAAAGNTISLGSAAMTGILTLGLSTAGQVTNMGAGVNTGAQSINIATGASGADSTVSVLSGVATAGTSTLNLNTGTGAITRNTNIATGAAVVNTISIGGTGANVIHIGDTQTAGSLSIGAAMTTGTISIGGTGLQTGTVTLSASTGAQTIAIGNANGTKTVTMFNGVDGNQITIGCGVITTAQAISIATGASGAASTVSVLTGVATTGTQTLSLNTGTGAVTRTTNIGTGAAVVNGINIGGTGANVIALGNTQTAGSVSIGDAMTTGTIAIGGSGAQTGTITISASTGAQTIAIANLGGAKTIGIGNGIDGNQITIGNGINTTSQTITIAGGASAANSTVNIMTGTLSSGAQTVNIGAVATTVGVKGVISLNASTNANVNICTGNSTGAVAIGNSAATTMLIQSGTGSATAIALTASNAAGGITLTAGTGLVNVAGTLALTSSATQLRVKGGAATDFIGTSSLTSGTVTINNTNIAATDRIFLQRTGANGSTTFGELNYTISASTSFTVTSLILGTPGSTQTGDTSTFTYFIVRQI